jgi:subtilisin family serine protease
MDERTRLELNEITNKLEAHREGKMVKIQEDDGVIISIPDDYVVHEEMDELEPGEKVRKFLSLRGDPDKVLQMGNFGRGIKIGVADTGVDATHRRGCLRNVKKIKDFTRSRSGVNDVQGHGSHVTGHIGATNTGEGMVGLCPEAELYHAKVLGDNGSGSSVGIAAGIDWLVEQGCHIINLSLGGSRSSVIEDAVKRATNAGVLVFAAIGNSGTRGHGHPGNSSYTIAVAALDYLKRVARFSSRFDNIHVSGYGVDVISLAPRGRYATSSGTSMACPDQAGVAGLILAQELKLFGEIKTKSMTQYLTKVKPFMEDLGRDGQDREYGLGFIDFLKLAEAVSDSVGDEPKPDPEFKDPISASLTLNGKPYLKVSKDNKAASDVRVDILKTDGTKYRFFAKHFD